MTKPKNHHYVPQAYLKRFSSNGTQIHVFDKFNQRKFVSNVKNVASETYFYDVNQDQISEILQRIENHKSEFTSDELQEVVESVKELGTLEQRLSQVEVIYPPSN